MARARFQLTLFSLGVAGLAALLIHPGASARPARTPALPQLQRQFQAPPDGSRIMMRWWWFGPAVTPEGLEREILLVIEGGIGGFEVQPVYALTSRRLRLQTFAVDGGATSIRLPALEPGEDLVAAFLGRGDPNNLDPQSLPQLTGASGNEIRLPPFSGRHTVMFVIAGRTGQRVKRAAVGEKLNEAAGPGSIRAMFCDNLEVYGADWADDLLAEFLKRRGYDLKLLLPALFMNIGGKTGAVRHDWGQTLSELLDERFIAPLAAWRRAASR